MFDELVEPCFGACGICDKAFENEYFGQSIPFSMSNAVVVDFRSKFDSHI